MYSTAALVTARVSNTFFPSHCKNTTPKKNTMSDDCPVECDKTSTDSVHPPTYAEVVKTGKKRTLSPYQKFVADRLKNDPNIRNLPNNKRLAAVGALWRVERQKQKK